MSAKDQDVDEPTNNVIPSFSFSGCGFLGVYHVGVAACLRDYTDIVSRKEIRFGGASAGALVATTLLCGIEFGEVTKLLLSVANAIRQRDRIDLDALLRNLMNRYLPENAHIELANRLHISMTKVYGMAGVLVTEFESKDHLIDCLLASAFVPGYTGWFPPSMDEETFLDISKKPRSPADRNRVVEREQASGSGSVSPSASASASDSASTSREESSDDTDANKPDVEKDRSNEGYLEYLVRLCFMGLNRTTKMVCRVPLASRIINTFVPSSLVGEDGLVEVILSECLSNKYLVLDGGFSDNIPTFDKNTISVSPFSGEADICPRDCTAVDFNVDLGRTSMHYSEDNIFRLSHALNPMDPKMLLKLCEEGYNQCLVFLEKRNLLSCRRHLMTRAAISTSPCNIGHAYCRCTICAKADLKIRSSLACIQCQKIRQKALHSHLPEDVKNEFKKAIAKYESQVVTHTFWSRMVSLLWWFVETSYAGTMGLTELLIKFYCWQQRFWDNFACFTKFAVLPLGQKRKFVRCMLSSLRTYMASS